LKHPEITHFDINEKGEVSIRQSADVGEAKPEGSKDQSNRSNGSRGEKPHVGSKDPVVKKEINDSEDDEEDEEGGSSES
jgi:hypothetical protein